MWTHLVSVNENGIVKSDWAKKCDSWAFGRSFCNHARADLNQPHNTSGFIREDQWQNFLKPNYPERPGITNIRDKGDDLHIATFLGQDCNNGNFTIPSGTYLINEIKWP